MVNCNSGNAVVEAALRYASLDYSVFPLVPRDKNPLTEHGCHDATTDVETIRQWWRQWPNANIGIACEGLFVIDVDPASDGGPNPWLKTDLGASLRLADGPAAITPRGGRHFYFRAPDAIGLKPGASRIAPHVDHRTGAGSYIVAPPSIGENEASYCWEVPLDCTVDLLPPAPDEVINLLTERPKQGHSTSRSNCVKNQKPQPIPTGRRNAELTREAGRLRRAGCEAPVIATALQAINQQRCLPPLGDSEVASIANSVSRYSVNGRSGGVSSVSEAVTHRLCDVQPEQLQWLWPSRIPLGKLTLLAGDPGLGKSLVTCDLAARVSRGAAWPDELARQQPVGSVLMFNCEDGLADTIRPRLEHAGADLTKIVAIEGVKVFDPDTGATRQRGFSLASDMPRLADELAKLTDCRLVVIDPVSAYLGDADSHKNADVRALLAPLAELAEKHRVAIVMVNHLSKSGGAKSIYRAMGSVGFIAAARAAWHVAKDPDDDKRRLILPAKMNLAPDPTGLAFRIESGAVHWEAAPVEMTADELLVREAETKPNARATQRDQAALWLRELLKDGPVPSKQVLADGREHGFGEKLLRSVLETIGGTPQKRGMEGSWFWSLPTEGGAEVADWSKVFPPGLPEDGPNLPKMPPF